MVQGETYHTEVIARLDEGVERHSEIVVHLSEGAARHTEVITSIGELRRHIRGGPSSTMCVIAFRRGRQIISRN